VEPASRPPLPIEIIYSTRRRKTVQATIVDGVIRVQAPARISKKELDSTVATLVERLERRHLAEGVDLEDRARRLARRFDLPRPTSVHWAEQRSRWGSCTPSTGAIRLSTRLAPWPPWVLDYVIVHELAHLVEFDHSPAFHAIVDRYPLAERARGFLIAKSLGEQDTSDGDHTDAVETGEIGTGQPPHSEGSGGSILD
jgi:predicted metal-dependent hydrolase